MGSEVLVSIVIPTYKGEKFIKQTVESVMNQTYSNFELIIGDQNPDDETKKILKPFEHDSRVKIVNVPKGDGASTNWNYVSELATGEYFKLLPHDDILKSDMIQRQVELLNVNPKVGMTSSKREIISDHGEILKSNWGLDGIKHLTDGREVVRETIKKGRNVVGEPGSVLMRKSIFDKIGGWDFSHPYVVDLSTFFHILMVSDFIADDYNGVQFRVSQTQWSSVLRDSQSEDVIALNHQIAEKHPKFLSKKELFIGDNKAKFMASVRKVFFIVDSLKQRSNLKLRYK
ncbi:glycosyltransferase [Leuconostoc falkenbergense]|uniref:Glycosyltransferase n=1 Tax=Leuconostoc falkenbergense TaxID=2766470 RepID=A0A9X3E917_9LACO|nr:glycosyltransferase [Leuconostoc falkenbergense]MCX7579364.1 glycosyltransferase [Leuconostoc falkenbergense]